jgi:catechol 2,3-dioxygenase-like lactoylglutathione lyase family enzyme
VTAPPRLSQVLVPVGDLDAALAFYTERIGLALLFRDGHSFAAMDGGGVKLALLGPAERAVERGVAPGLKVADLDRLAARGAFELDAIRVGRHERFVELVDPSGNPLVCYEPLTPPPTR